MQIKFSCEIKGSRAEAGLAARALAERIKAGAEGPFTLRDSNGNKVGKAFLEIGEDEAEQHHGPSTSDT